MAVANQKSAVAAITYRVILRDPAAHLLEVELTLDRTLSTCAKLATTEARTGSRTGARTETAAIRTATKASKRLAHDAYRMAAPVTLTLPSWIPGSYMIREFARHIVAIEAHCDGRKVALHKSDKDSWQTAPFDGPLVVRYQVYAWDLSVRTAHFDDSHVFFNGTSLFLRIAPYDDEPCLVDIEAPLHLPEEASLRSARVATTLARAGARKWGFGRYRAQNYDELIDHPVEIGAFSLFSFTVGELAHHVVISGQHDCDGKRLVADLTRICASQIRLFEPRSQKAPFAQYLFLVHAVGDGYGGLEHRSSTALICARNDLPYPAMRDSTEGYRRFLGLASHEYFHSWHVKRIKPAAFVPYQLNRENYTRLLWIFEGFTSYYDDLMLVRSGVITCAQYLNALAATASAVLRGPGRRRQSVAESSFEAWNKYYRQDEQSPNSIVSYYAKGALVALALDLSLRQRSDGKRSLDDVMRLLWRRFGRDFKHQPKGLREDEFPQLLSEATGVDLKHELRSWAYGTRDIELAPLLAPLAVTLAYEPAQPQPWLGAKLNTRAGELSVATVYHDGPAHTAGLSAGDVLLALQGLRIDDASLKAALTRYEPGDTVRLHVFRRDQLRQFDVKLTIPPATEARLTLSTKASMAQLQQRRRWLGQ